MGKIDYQLVVGACVLAFLVFPTQIIGIFLPLSAESSENKTIEEYYDCDHNPFLLTEKSCEKSRPKPSTTNNATVTVTLTGEQIDTLREYSALEMPEQPSSFEIANALKALLSKIIDGEIYFEGDDDWMDAMEPSFEMEPRASR